MSACFLSFLFCSVVAWLKRRKPLNLSHFIFEGESLNWKFTINFFSRFQSQGFWRIINFNEISFFFMLQARKKWNTKLVSGTKSASVVASARRPSEPSRLFPVNRTFTALDATKTSLQHAAWNAERWDDEFVEGEVNWINLLSSGDHNRRRDIQERSMASWMLHMHPLSDPIGRPTVH